MGKPQPGQTRSNCKTDSMQLSQNTDVSGTKAVQAAQRAGQRSWVAKRINIKPYRQISTKVVHGLDIRRANQGGGLS
jgi:uncharacterized ParB-like nuclease family protein